MPTTCLKNAVGGIAEIINVPGHVNVDFEDVRTVMVSLAKPADGYPRTNGPDQVCIAAEQAVARPPLEGTDLSVLKVCWCRDPAAKGLPN
jgi:cell division protein FtsZ